VHPKSGAPKGCGYQVRRRESDGNPPSAWHSGHGRLATWFSR